MSSDKLSRRSFIRKASMATAGTVTGVLTGRGQASTKAGDTKTNFDTYYIPDFTGSP